MSSIRYQTDERGIVTLVLDAPDRVVNTMDIAFRADLEQVVDRLEAERDAIRGVILTSAKRTFFVGADLRALLAVRPENAAHFFEELERLKADLRRIERLGRPVVAAINGSALGSGFELALACHARICLEDPSIELGFPEVTFGLMPGVGGTVKTVRLLGLQEALPLLLEGRRFSPTRAGTFGLVDALAPNPERLIALALAWIDAHPDARQPWDSPGHRIPGGTPSSPAVAAMLPITTAMLQQRTHGNYPAPEAILSAAVESTQVDFDTAMRVESRYLTRLIVDPVAKNLIGTLFFQARETGSATEGAVHENTIVFNDGHGSYRSRVFGAFMNEGMALLGEGVPAALIENAAMQLGMPAGPLAVLDESSLKLADDVLHRERADAQHEHPAEPAHSHSAATGHDPVHEHDHPGAHERQHRIAESAVYVLEKMAHGYRRLGRAYGGGFYDYPAGGQKSLWPGLQAFERTATRVPLDDIRDRLLYVQSLETIRCLDAGIIETARDANVGSIFGWGFPAWTGGTLRFVDHVGAGRFTQRAGELARDYGERFEPPALLMHHQRTGEPIGAAPVTPATDTAP